MSGKLQDEHQNDAVNIALLLHKVLFEDDKLRVIEVLVKTWR
jgi:hypothetical protein